MPIWNKKKRSSRVKWKLRIVSVLEPDDDGMTQTQLLLRLQKKILSNYLRREFASKTLVEAGFGLFLILATMVRFHRDIGLLWIHARPSALVPIFQNGLFAIFFLFVFAFQFPARRVLRIPSGDVLLSLPLSPNALYLFRANALLIRTAGWVALVFSFYLLAFVRFAQTGLLVHLVQLLTVTLVFLALAEVLWTGILLFQLLFTPAKSLIQTVAAFFLEIGLFFLLALSREFLLPFFHPERVFCAWFPVLSAFAFLIFLETNRRLFLLALKREIHLKPDSQARLVPFVGRLAGRLFFFFPNKIRAVIDLELQTQLRKNAGLKAVFLIFILILLTAQIVSHSAADFIQNSLFAVLVLWIFLSAFFFGTQDGARQSVTFYKSQPLHFGTLWAGRATALFLIYFILDAAYLVLILLLYPGESVPLWSVTVLFSFSFFLSILQTNFHFTLLQNVRTGEILYLIFWAVNWIFWFVFPFLPLVFLFAGAFAVRPARTRFEGMEETWSP